MLAKTHPMHLEPLFIIDAIQRLVMLLLRPFTNSLHEIQDRWRSIGTTDWRLGNGHIETATVESTRNPYWSVELLYSYHAEEEYWSGRTSRPFFAEPDADEYARAHPRGSAVVVRYRPGKASKSVVLKRDQLSASAAGAI